MIVYADDIILINANTNRSELINQTKNSIIMIIHVLY